LSGRPLDSSPIAACRIAALQCLHRQPATFPQLLAQVEAMTTKDRRKSRLAAVLVTDTVDYTKRMDANEPATIAAVKACTAKQREVIKHHRGKFIKGTGDGTISTYASAVDALKAAIKIQTAVTAMNRRKRRDRQIVLRAGLAVGDVYEDGGDIQSRCAIMASRLEAIATPGTICLPVSARDDLEGKVPVKFDNLGLHTLKGFPRPVQLCQADPRIRVTKSAAEKSAKTVFNLDRAHLTGGGDVEPRGGERVFRVEVMNLGKVLAYLFAFDVQFATLEEVRAESLPVSEKCALNLRIRPDEDRTVIGRIPITRPDANVVYGAFWYRDVPGTPKRESRFILRIADDGHTLLDVPGVPPDSDYTRWT
jgi:class 3 adenylate cyclase